MSNLGRLMKVQLRDVWSDESGDFTPWLAREENIALLGEAIGIELEVQDQEARVGRFRADIFCRDTLTSALVLIENQLERTDHQHLGQLMTYAAGLDAVSIVWIAERFTEEHRAALDWLNRVTHEGVNFFGLEVELWRIGESVPAPKFNVVCKPNDWAKTLSQGARPDLTETKQLQMEYWAALGEYLRTQGSSLKPPAAQPAHSVNFSIGRSEVTLGARALPGKEIAVGLYLFGPNAKPRFHSLETDKAAIEKEIGCELAWEEKPSQKVSTIRVYNALDPSDRDGWPEMHEWTKKMLEAFDKAFRPRLGA